MHSYGQKKWYSHFSKLYTDNQLFCFFAPQYSTDYTKYAPYAYCTLQLSSYGSPLGNVINGQDSYGSPLGNVINGQGNSAINPRLPGGGSTLYSASGDATRASGLSQNPFIATSVNPDDSYTAPIVPDKVTLTQPGYGWVSNKIQAAAFSITCMTITCITWVSFK